MTAIIKCITAITERTIDNEQRIILLENQYCKLVEQLDIQPHRNNRKKNKNNYKAERAEKAAANNIL